MPDEWNNPQLAQEYSDKLDQVDWYEYELNMPSWFSLIPEDTQHVLDFGSGPGQFTAKLSASYKVDGADASQAMIDIANKSFPDIKFFMWDGQSPYPEKHRYDTIFSKLTLHFLSDLHAFARYAQDALTDDGCIVVSLIHPLRTIGKVSNQYASVKTYDGAIGKYNLHVTMIHRSLEEYIRPFLDNDYVLTGILEPVATKEQVAAHELPAEDMFIPKRLNLRFQKAQ